MNKKRFLNVADVAAVMGVSVPTAYEIIHRLNDELSAPGFITVAGKVSRSYFEQKAYCSVQETPNVSEKL